MNEPTRPQDVRRAYAFRTLYRALNGSHEVEHDFWATDINDACEQQEGPDGHHARFAKQGYRPLYTECVDSEHPLNKRTNGKK
jgi:hypothetical protein